MKNNEGKSVDKSRIVPVSIIFVVLCGLSFYMGVLFGSENDRFASIISQRTIAFRKESSSSISSLKINDTSFPECSIDYQDFTPCTDPMRWKKYGSYRYIMLERHCPPIFERKKCLVPPPDGYKPPIRWPKSRDECWYRNVPFDWINEQKSNQHWLRKEGEKFFFPGGGTMFPNGVGKYVDLMEDLIPEMKDGTIRTAIDTGCGVASWGGDLLDRGILTVSLAPRDNHQAQVQFALERGLPAILGVLALHRLPFPSNSFDMAHCSRCLIPWTDFGGVYLLEIHRILRPGGFWVLSGPPINYERRWRGWDTTIEEQKSNFEKLQELLTSLCFELYNKKGDIAVWQKSRDSVCYKNRTKDAYPPKCDDSLEADSACGSALSFKNDNSKWKKHITHYKKLIPELGTDKIRNVMDMNTLYGGFAAALIDDPVWVMNVVSSYAPNTLPVIYDRGLIGTFHDWCEAFSTYPRTYDLLHLAGLFTAESHRCEMKYVLLEMDRILRPDGYAIIRESSYFLDALTTIAKGIRWECRKEDTEQGGDAEKILICKKKLWYSSIKVSR
ncbi:unnamed protein product [Vicia faba]|uniref:Methyltransferase n=1 Tax=Vicia faba TaxID=3906 RepID=A0AAV1AGM5_VICFA|nr:unnamed protein product [Vicia faba]